jgi:RNA polymerase sigma factor (sigma-70 family)
MTHLHFRVFLRDEDFLREIRAGGPRADIAIGCLYQQYRKRVYASMRRLIFRHPAFKGAPEDLMHDAFILMIQKIQYEAVDIHSILSFWIGIGKNLFLNQLKKDEKMFLVRDSEEIYGLNELSPEIEYLNHEEEELMLSTFSKLGARCREILLLWVNQYSMVEIAEKMSISNDNMARKIKFDCFKKLKDLVRTGNTIAR